MEFLRVACRVSVEQERHILSSAADWKRDKLYGHDSHLQLRDVTAWDVQRSCRPYGDWLGHVTATWTRIVRATARWLLKKYPG